MSILITGGCGFIGSHLCEFYTSVGTPVTVLDDLSSGKRDNLTHPDLVTLVEGDIADRELVAKLVADAEQVYHLAAIASVAVCTEQPERATRTNVAGTQAVFDAVAATGRSIPVVYASSAAVYGDNPELPLSETSEPTPISLYAEHKLKNERIAARAFEDHGVRSVGLRFFNVYGARQDAASPYSGVISKFIERAAAGAPLTIFGDGEQTRDFVYVGDVVTMLTQAAEYARAAMLFGSSPTGADRFNVCTGRATSLKRLAQTIGAIYGRESLELQFAPAREGDIRHSLGNPASIMQALSVMEWTPLALGLQQTVIHHA